MNLLTSITDVKFSLVILKSCFEATLELFWDGSRKFEPRSEDQNETLAGTPLSKLPPHTIGDKYVQYWSLLLHSVYQVCNAIFAKHSGAYFSECWQ
ncbi:hypothetical protein AVEN_52844-1 [Araneus ventricosus]|uniref:Uncharacterized protein n=1 Tax=Araneus ventricosus TaxID=182803 RepID=A0A4Y2GH63_ARAVE|nr:hypothetical protein AVEN_51013-1 [Araneus ventricosus]GBM52701.1 hypothetical protein AVEN_52844-1 [Araneus ventricosus]